ncbi:PHD finger-like domain-containing protein 5A isoform X1 [Salvelinus fontinalis]|uniref:PHD finger-like domain-containing protein 5A isoform X1 n=1 Tax=Salvelinus fontinalis TaxID=8038 RepID=UPI002486B407|nr:PHD finger-like domain-containing protein 5A isoform X1 [Salvelinus fontinalis]
MAKHHPDLIFCRKQAGVAIGRLCEKCDGKCVICDSYVRPCTLVRICDECNYGSYQGRCVICGGPGVSDAYYCKECTIQEKDVSRLLSLSLTYKRCRKTFTPFNAPVSFMQCFQ